MPKPNCIEAADVGVIDFGRLGRRVVEGRFDGGSMTSDAGVLMLSALDRKLGLLDAASQCIADPRNPLLITHGVRDMLRQRVYGLALGWQDLNDHAALRCDVAMQTAVGVQREVASAPTLCRLESWADRASAVRLHRLLVEKFIASFNTAPEELVLDFDATDNPLYGQQEGRFFHGYYDSYCYLPLYVFCAPAVAVRVPAPQPHRCRAACRGDPQAVGQAAAPSLARGAHRLQRRLGLLPPALDQLVRALGRALHHRVGTQRAAGGDCAVRATGDEGAKVDTLRTRLLKVAAVITRNSRRIRLYLASNWPSATVFAQAMRMLRSP